MDNLAHALVGAALGRAVADRHVARAGLIGAVAANMPDWAEMFTGYLNWSRSDFLVHHRGITHSLTAAPIEIAALILAMGFLARGWKRWRGRGNVPSWKWLAICVTATFLSHLFMDWQGSYGWRPFLPWNNTWYYLDWVAIADPFFWLVPLVALAWGADRHWLPLAATVLGVALIAGVILRYLSAGGSVSPWVLPACVIITAVAAVGWIRFWFGPVARKRTASIGVAILAVYSLAQGIAVQTRKTAIRQQAVQRFGSTAQWAALTTIGEPFTWDAVYASPDTIVGENWKVQRNLRVPAVTRAIQGTQDGHAIAQFARFLAARVDTTEKTVYLWDARYARGVRAGWATVSVRMGSTR